MVYGVSNLTVSISALFGIPSFMIQEHKSMRLNFTPKFIMMSCCTRLSNIFTQLLSYMIDDEHLLFPAISAISIGNKLSLVQVRSFRPTESHLILFHIRQSLWEPITGFEVVI